MKFINSIFDKEEGTSEVTMEHMGQYFVGKARLHPDDKDKISEYAGCSYAEARATIAALKYERKMAKEKSENIRKFIKACECYKDWDKGSPAAKIAYRQLNIYIKRVNHLTEVINDMMFTLDKSIWKRDVTIKAMREARQKIRQKAKKLNL